MRVIQFYLKTGSYVDIYPLGVVLSLQNNDKTVHYGQMTTNFSFLEQHAPLLSQLALSAERAFVAEPNTTLVKLRQLGEAIAQDIASRLGIDFEDRSTQLYLLRKIQLEVDINREVIDTFLRP